MAINLDRQVLRDELDDDPAGLGYAGMTDAEAAEALNLPRDQGTEQVPVSYETLLDKAAMSGAVRAAVAGIFASSQASAKQFVERMRYVGSLSTAAGSSGEAILNALASDGVLTQAQVDVFISWGEQALPMVSRREELGWDPITEQDVAEARAL